MKKKFKLLILITITSLGFSQAALLAMEPEIPDKFSLHSTKLKSAESFFEFQGLSLDNIKSNHQRLKTSVDNCYEDAKKHFVPGGKWNNRNDFDFKKGVNLCGIGVQWVIQTAETQYISEFQELTDSNGKKLISSNTSSFQWNSTVMEELNFHVLSWPVVRNAGFNAYDLMIKDVPKPSLLWQISDSFFIEIYKESFNAVKVFLEKSFKFIENKVLKNIPFNSLKEEEKKLLEKFEDFFPNRDFLYWPPKSKKPNNYFYEKNLPTLISFLNSYKSSLLGNEKIDIEVVLQNNDLFKEKLYFLSNNPYSDLSKYSYLLNINKNEYKNIKENDNLIIDTRENYPLDVNYEIDIFHSEPLLSWCVDKNIESMRFNILKKFNEQKENEKIRNIFPIFFFYTERQTCPSCENIIQKTACGKYVPLIAFNNSYPPDYVLLSGSRLPLSSRNFTPPYSTPPSNSFLPFLLLEKLKDIKEPTDLHPEPFQVNYNKNYNQFFSFVKETQKSTQNKMKTMEDNFNSLNKIHKQCKLNFNFLPKNDVEENLIYKALSLNNDFQDLMLNLMNTQIEVEKNLMIKTEGFIKIQEENLSYEESILIDFKNSFQRIPIQYNM